MRPAPPNLQTKWHAKYSHKLAFDVICSFVQTNLINLMSCNHDYSVFMKPN